MRFLVAHVGRWWATQRHAALRETIWKNEAKDAMTPPLEPAASNRRVWLPSTNNRSWLIQISCRRSEWPTNDLYPSPNRVEAAVRRDTSEGFSLYFASFGVQRHFICLSHALHFFHAGQRGLDDLELLSPGESSCYSRQASQDPSPG